MVRMEVNQIPKFRRLTKTERILIAQLRNKGYSNKRIAWFLGRAVSSIGREIRRNRFKEEIYEPLHAQGKAERRKEKAWGAKHPLKNPWVYEYLDEWRYFPNGVNDDQIDGTTQCLRYISETEFSTDFNIVSLNKESLFYNF